MKNIILLLFMIISSTVFAQKQKEKDMLAQIDALTKTNKLLSESIKIQTLRVDSCSTELSKYHGLYTVIKDKVVKMDFNPANMSQIIDSLRAGRDSLINISGATGLLLKDSITHINHLNDSLRKEVEGLRYAVNLLKGGHGTAPADPKDFTGTWNLILRKVRVVGQSPRAGIIDASAEPATKTANFLESNPITTITFLDGEFAELTFTGGEKGKCYFVINEFSKTKPYSIDFKGTKADFRMYFMNTAIGSRISLQIPGVEGLFYFGEMTK